MRLVSWNARSNVCRHTIKCRLLFIWTSAFQLLSMRLNFYFIILFNIVQDSLGYGFIPAFRQAGSKQKSDRAVLFHRLVFTSVLGLRHFRNTGRYIRIVTGLLLMQICGQFNISFFSFFFPLNYMCFCGSSLPIAHQGRQVWCSKMFSRRKKSGGEYIINNGGSASTCQH